MQRRNSIIIWILVLFALWNKNANGAHPVEHLIVIMMENRSYDHLLGYLSMQRPQANMDGLTGTESNPFDPSDPNSPRITVTNNASRIAEIDPPHTVKAASFQTFGYYDPNDGYDRTAVPPMNGFVKAGEDDHPGWGPGTMVCFAPSTLPVTTKLVEEFAVFNRWFSSVPGPTQVNRMYLHAATSHGEIHNSRDRMVQGYPQRTIFQNLEDSNVPWKIYIDPITTTLVFSQMRYPKYLARMREYKYFQEDVLNGKLDKYVVIEPAFYTWGDHHPATDMHPGHDMAEGERLIKEVYELIRNSKYWEKSAILITFDEHGGFFDHVPPPMQGVPNPDGINSDGGPNFAFDRLGQRVPTILISPRVKKGSVIGAPSSGQWEHSSVPATVKKLFGLQSFLTNRDAWAASFENLISGPVRQDCPRLLPQPLSEIRQATQSGPLSGLQEDLSTLAGGLNMWLPIAQTSVGALSNENDAFMFTRTQVNAYLTRKTRGLNVQS